MVKPNELTHARFRPLAPLIPRQLLMWKREQYASIFRGRNRRSLQRLNDVLSQTGFAGKYWLTGGLLLGWARDGQVLKWDYWDSDFGFYAQDDALFKSLKPHLQRAGFNLLGAAPNNAGEPAIYTFVRNGSKFEFYNMYRRNGGVESYSYSAAGDVLEEYLFRVPEHALKSIRFLDRTWNVPDDHEQYLTYVYGDWHTPKPDFNWTKEYLNIVAHYPWRDPEVKDLNH